MGAVKHLIEEIIELWDAGAESYEIAERLNIDEQWVIDAINDFGPAMSTRWATDIEPEFKTTHLG